jgi:carbon-monoxide dehydrogenase medium subunit
MIPAQFDYVAPATLDEAVRLLADHADDAKILAGGQSLLPAMKLRLAQPALLVDIGRIRDLSYISAENGHVRIGAMTTHYELESSPVLAERCPLLPETAAHIGDVQVRNKGTIGGSLVHADPAADWPAAVLALGAELVLVGPSGERTVSADDFFVDMMTTAVEPNEILREIRVPARRERTGWSYMKVRQPASGFAVVGVAACVARGADGSCEEARVGVTGIASKAFRATAVERALAGAALDNNQGDLGAAAALVDEGVDVNGDLYASADYRRHLARVYARRAIAAAAAKAH